MLRLINSLLRAAAAGGDDDINNAPAPVAFSDSSFCLLSGRDSRTCSNANAGVGGGGGGGADFLIT